MFEVPLSRRVHQERRAVTVIDYNKYKIGVKKSNQMLEYYYFQRK
jgi:hypothetical protein